jgi:hypothetical protein
MNKGHDQNKSRRMGRGAPWLPAIIRFAVTTMPGCTAARLTAGFCAGISIFTLSSMESYAQTIQPLIAEYVVKADGKFEIANDTLTPMAIVLEPKSFSIAEDGRGIYRPLDPGIHVKLSDTSFLLQPKETSYVFYKVTADQLPAWFTVYASFSPIHPGEGLRVRVMLPHTVYLYQKKPIDKDSIHIKDSGYRAGSQTVECDLHNEGPALVRVQEVRVVSGKTTVQAAGFPLLPGGTRHLAIDWKENVPPQFLLLHFPRFDVKEPLATAGP